MRAMDSEKASLKIGDRVPIATGSFQSGLGGSVNTQFQYLDVGVNIDITPYVHADNEVTLKMSMEISSVTGVQNIGGFSQPTIGQRRIEHEARLSDGEVNLIGGILQDTDTNSMSGYPWLMKIPILKYLFGQETKERTTTEVVFAITPHIVRGRDVMDDNLRILDVGTAGTVTYRRDNSPKSGAGNTNSSSPEPQPTSGPPVSKVQPQPTATPAQSNTGSESHPALKPSPQPIAALNSSPVKPALSSQPILVIPAGTVKPAQSDLATAKPIP
jgi:general secretion pathway protein D